MPGVSTGSGLAGGYFEPLSKAKYTSVTTFRRSGQPVATPVHVVTDGDVAYFRTWDVSGKAKRLRHTSGGGGTQHDPRPRLRALAQGRGPPAGRCGERDRGAAHRAAAPGPARQADSLAAPKARLGHPAVPARSADRVPLTCGARRD